MAKQLLITLAVAVIVVLVARIKRNRRDTSSSTEEGSPAQARPRLSTTARVGYSLAAAMIAVAAGVTWSTWVERNEIIEVVVVDTRSGERTVYEVRRKFLGEREFRTVDGRIVSLGAADRMERTE